MLFAGHVRIGNAAVRHDRTAPPDKPRPFLHGNERRRVQKPIHENPKGPARDADQAQKGDPANEAARAAQ